MKFHQNADEEVKGRGRGGLRRRRKCGPGDVLCFLLIMDLVGVEESGKERILERRSRGRLGQGRGGSKNGCEEVV